jgi:presenilin-like A22 family membrane protease
LFALNQNTVVEKTPEGEIIVEHEDTAIGERPNIEGPSTFAYMIVAILIGTGLILLLIRLKKIKIWRMMYFFAVWMTCSITLGVFINPTVAFIFCFVLAFLKLYKVNVWIHNLTELLIYSGIAIIFVPLLDIVWVTILLLAISAYDMFAVWKSKHMISLAEFQTKGKAFAGIMLSYKMKLRGKLKKVKGEFEVKNAILGGGDIAFPLLFSGVVMDSLIKSGFVKPLAFLQSLIIPIVVALVLFILLMKAKKDKFYPAMPFLTFGCFVGYGLVFLVNLF